MKLAKPIAIAFLIYVAVVVVFESLLGYFQPEGQNTIVITTSDEDGNAHDRVVTRLESNGRLYVASNHWPRSWYRRALENPKVQVTIDDETRDYLAVPMTEDEYNRVNNEHSRTLAFKALTGFPPRYIVRLDPR